MFAMLYPKQYKDIKKRQLCSKKFVLLPGQIHLTKSEAKQFVKQFYQSLEQRSPHGLPKIPRIRPFNYPIVYYLFIPHGLDGIVSYSPIAICHIL